jgi:hypothetical protein
MAIELKGESRCEWKRKEKRKWERHRRGYGGFIYVEAEAVLTALPH